MTAVGARAARRRRERVQAQQKPVDIGVCSGRDSAYVDFFLALEGVRQQTVSVLHWIRGADIPMSRNTIARRATGDHVWFVDDDHTFPPDTLDRLLARDVPIVAPLVLTKRSPFRPVAFTHHNGLGYVAATPEEIPTDGSLLQVEACGAAGMLIHRDVLDTLTDPWFEAGKVDAQAIGEDLHFCAKAREAGFLIHVDPSVRIGHLAPVSIGPVEDDGWHVSFDIGGASFSVPA